MISFRAAIFLILLGIINHYSCFVSIEFTNGRPIFYGDNKTIKFDKLRVRRVNRSAHVVTGSFETFVELGADFDVSRQFTANIYQLMKNIYKF